MVIAMRSTIRQPESGRIPMREQGQTKEEALMKIKTNLRAGAKSGTVASGKKNSSSSAPEVNVELAHSPVVVSTTRCAGL